MLTVGLYHGRLRGGRLTPAFAARLGLLTALLTTLSCAIVFVAALVIARYGLHSAVVDTQIGAALAQIRHNIQVQYGSTGQPVLDMLRVPEFRVGFLLWMCTFSAGIYLLLSTVAAGLAGLLLGRRRPA